MLSIEVADLWRRGGSAIGSGKAASASSFPLRTRQQEGCSRRERACRYKRGAYIPRPRKLAEFVISARQMQRYPLLFLKLSSSIRELPEAAAAQELGLITC
jgi:hypothetical protein